MPIPEESGARTSTYGDLLCFTRPGTLAELLDSRFRPLRAHADPDFDTCVYGDVLSREVELNGSTFARPVNRAASLVGAQPGDELWFLARLWDWTDRERSAQYFVGFFAIETAPVTLERATDLAHHAPGVFERIRMGANYLRLEAGEREMAIFILGDRKKSQRFPVALEVDHELSGIVYGADRADPAADRYYRDGIELKSRTKPWRPRTFESFKSVTRSIQPFLESGRDDECIAHLHSKAREAGCM